MPLLLRAAGAPRPEAVVFFYHRSNFAESWTKKKRPFQTKCPNFSRRNKHRLLCLSPELFHFKLFVVSTNPTKKVQILSPTKDSKKSKNLQQQLTA